MRYYWYHKVCAAAFPSTTFVLQSLHKANFPVLLCTTHACAKYFPELLRTTRACTKYFPVLLRTTKLAQRTSQYYLVLQSLHKARPSTALYYKARKKNILVTPCTTKLAQSTPQYSDYTAFCSITWLTRISVRTWSQSVTTIMQLLRCDLQPGIQHAHRTTRA